MTKKVFFLAVLLVSIAALMASCAPSEVIKEVIVTQEVEVEKEVVVTQEVEVEKEVVVTVEVEKEEAPEQTVIFALYQEPQILISLIRPLCVQR